MYTNYTFYKKFKETEADIKGVKPKVLTEDMFLKRVSEKNHDIIGKCADLFNTRFSSVDLSEYIKCGFHHFKTFNFDKMFREVVLQEYIARDRRKKMNVKEGMAKILDDMKYINMYIDDYTKIEDGGIRRIIRDYLDNKIGNTIVVYCIWRCIFVPSDIEWEYLEIIKNNYPEHEKNVAKFAGMIDNWRSKMKAKRNE